MKVFLYTFLKKNTRTIENFEELHKELVLEVYDDICWYMDVSKN